jgi:CDP-L-myo-inositol myo-inositolphosphotransferase
MKALIIAAGEGSRLGDLTKSKPKPLTQLLGRALIERVILTAKQVGIDDFVIVVGCQGEKIQKALGGGSKYGVKITYIQNPDWHEGNLTSALSAREKLSENFFLLMADHVFDGRILRGLKRRANDSAVVLAIDRRTPRAEDCRVLESEGKILAIGKDIPRFNAVDTGIFLCTPRIFTYLEAAREQGGKELADGITIAVSCHDAEVFDITQIDSYLSKLRKDVPPWWVDIDTQRDLFRARQIIIENASKNPSDALACYVHKPIENWLVAILAPTGLTANQMTVLVNVLAYAATALFFAGYLLPASLLAFLVGIADGLDGKLARVKLQTSRIGTLEHSFDLLFEFSWFIALAWAVYTSSGNAIALVLGSLIIVFIAFYRHVYDQFRKAMGRSLDDAGAFERRFKRVAGRRNLYNIPILVSILLGVPFYALVFILCHAGVTAFVYAWRAMKHLRE